MIHSNGRRESGRSVAPSVRMRSNSEEYIVLIGGIIGYQIGNVHNYEGTNLEGEGNVGIDRVQMQEVAKNFKGLRMRAGIMIIGCALATNEPKFIVIKWTRIIRRSLLLYWMENLTFLKFMHGMDIMVIVVLQILLRVCRGPSFGSLDSIFIV